MAKYLLGYRIEGALKAHSLKTGKPYRFNFKGHQIELLFPDKEKPISFFCFIDAEGDGYIDANTQANEIVSEFLDSLSFVMKSSLFLMELVVALKDETGKSIRTAFRHTTKDSLPAPLYLQDSSAEAVQKMLTQMETETNYDLSLRWLRYSYRARTWTEQFANQWLAFERLIGEKQIERTCPKCGEKLPSYPSVDKNDAFALIRKYYPELEWKQFEKIWKARQRMFHGGKMDTDFMKTLAEFSPKIGDVVERELVEKHQPTKKLWLEHPHKVARESNRQGFYEFTAEDPSAPFAMNYPTDEQLENFHEQDSVYGDGFQLVSIDEKIQDRW